MRAARVLVLVMACLGFGAGCDKADAYVGYQPPVLPVKIKVDTKGQVSISADASVVTPVGRFFAGVSAPLTPSSDGREMLVVIHRPGGILDVHRIVGAGKFQATVVGTTRFTIQDTRVDIEVDVDQGAANTAPTSCRLSPSLGVIRRKVEDANARCEDGDTCGYFLQLASTTCAEGGDGIAQYVQDLINGHGFEGEATVMVYVDKRGVLGAGAVLPEYERKQALTRALGRPMDKMFPGYSVWRSASAP